MYTLVLITISYIVYYILNYFSLTDSWQATWPFQVAGISASCVFIFIWLEGSVVFDEMMQVVTIKRYFSKVFQAKQIPYTDIKAIILKRYAHEDEDGHITHEGYFHLKLTRGSSYLLLVFNSQNSIENVRKQLLKHSKLKIQTF
ncbi:MAG: hypothetical protein ACSHWU_10395 [Marinicella sp.]